jgi:hypothetical protein
LKGYYLLARGWMDNPLFGPEPYDHRSAWVWLIEHAAFRPHIVQIGGRDYALERGQLPASVRYLAQAWGWEQTKVHRFLKKLKNENAIATRTATGSATHPQIVTICNYDKYQLPPGSVATQTATAEKPEPQQIRSKENLPSKEGGGAARGVQLNLPAIIFNEGLAYLISTGVQEVRARNLLGRWRNQTSDGAVIDAIDLAIKKAVSDPVGFIEATLQGRRRLVSRGGQGEAVI